MLLLRARLFYSAFVVLLASGVFAASLSAQQPKVLAPHNPVKPKLTERLPRAKPMANQSALGGLWMGGPNWKASLYLTNGLKTDPLTVTPSVYLSNGVRYKFDSVTIQPSATVIVDINQELEKQGIAPYATLSGYAQIEYQWPWAPVCASVRNLDTVHSLIFVYGLQPGDAAAIRGHDSSANQPQVLEGMWWKQEANVTGFVALSNITEKPIDASLQVTDRTNNTIGDHSVTVSPHGTKTVDLTELLATTDPTGGVLLTHNGPEFGLVVNGGLQDEATGYSAHMRLAPPLLDDAPLPTILSASPSNLQLNQPAGFAELGLMTGVADPMMNFPSGTVFTAYSAVRNISDHAVTITPTLWWMANSTVQSAQLSQVTVAPHQSVNLNVPELLVAAGLKNFNGSVNLVLDTKAPSGSLLIAAGSVDQKNNYVFEVMPRGIGESASKSLSYWSIGNGDDTMVTLWNPADEAQDFVFTVFYTGGHYLYPIHLEPRATQTFNISEIAHTGIPDSEGNVIPAGVYEGSAELRGSQGEQEHILVSMDAATYSVQKATCSIFCQSCNGVTGASMISSPFAVAVSAQTQQTFYEDWNTGSQYDDTTQSNWSSSNLSLATVQKGLVHGVSPGSVSVGATYIYNDPQYTSYWCEQSSWPCPLYLTTPEGGAGGNTVPSIISINPPQGAVGTTVQVVISGTGFGNVLANVTVGTASSIVVTPTNVSDNGTTATLNATFVIAPNASIGTVPVQVSVKVVEGSEVSNVVSFSVTPLVNSINPAQGPVGTALPVTINGNGFASGATVNAGSNISVSKVTVVSSTQITATFTPANSTQAGGNQSVTVVISGQPSPSVNFYVQIPAKLVFFNTGCAPNGQGPLQVITNGSVVDCGGVVQAQNFCGVNRNLTYQLVDQSASKNPFPVAYNLSESFSNLSTTNPALGLPTPSQNVPIAANAYVTDAQFVGFSYPTCLGSNDHHSYTQNFSASVGGVNYNLSTTVSISNGNFSGTPEDNVSITTP